MALVLLTLLNLFLPMRFKQDIQTFGKHIILFVCIISVRASCPTNWRYSSDLDMCYMALQPDSFDATLERCETAGGVLTSDLSKAALVRFTGKTNP